MNNRWLIVVGALLVTGVSGAQDAPALKTQEEKISYALGMDLGNQLRKLSAEVDPAVFAHGLKDALAGGKTLLNERQVKEAILLLQGQIKKKEAARRTGTSQTDGDDNVEAAILPAYNKRAAAEFLAANKKKEGVVVLPSGLQYKVLRAGDGKKPTEADMVVCNYRGTLFDGTEVDSSYKRNQPSTFSVKGVIAGWREALPLMSVGSKWQLVIPPELAYGEKGASGVIGPNAALVFEVELLAIK